MSKSTRSSRRVLKAVGSGSSVTLFSVLPVGGGAPPPPPPVQQTRKTTAEVARLSKNPHRQTDLSAFRYSPFDPQPLAEAIQPAQSGKPRRSFLPSADGAAMQLGKMGRGDRPRASPAVSPLGQGETRRPPCPTRHRTLGLDGGPDSSAWVHQYPAWLRRTCES